MVKRLRRLLKVRHMTYISGITHYTETFIENICSLCKLCDAHLPSFCMSAYAGDPNRFLKIVRYMHTLWLTKQTDKIMSIYSFEGFIGTFCNTQTPCPLRSPKCKEMDSMFRCYESFAIQCGSKTLHPKIKADAWARWMGVEPKLIGRRFRMPATNPLKALSKKQSRRIKQKLKKSKARMKFGLRREIFFNSMQVIPSKKKVPIKTTFFHNDNEEWERKIDLYLDSETNNRQSTTTT